MRGIKTFFLAVILATVGTANCPAAESAGLKMLRVDGRQLKTIDGKTAHLEGVNLPSMEWGQGEHLAESERVAIDVWHANVIRLPLSQDRWFGHGKEKKDGGASYRKKVQDFVAQATARRCYVIIDLHWSDANIWGEYIGQHKMPDNNSIAFWNEVAPLFANHPAVLLDLYNEPHSVSWEIWRNGGPVTETSKTAPGGKLIYTTPGMQALLNLCRAKGARNVIVAGGLDYAYDLTGIVKGYALSDPQGNGVIYSTHLYPMKKDWDKFVTPAIGKYAVIVGEVGSGGGFMTQAFQYINQHELPWVAWCLHRDAKPALIKDWNYTPTESGQEVINALKAPH